VLTFVQVVQSMLDNSYFMVELEDIELYLQFYTGLLDVKSKSEESKVNLNKDKRF
jgi:hypothetical protein